MTDINDSKYTKHYSVMRDECISFLTENCSESEKSYFADLTFGGGGHSFALLETNVNYELVSVDQDPDALENGKKRIEGEGVKDRIELVASNFEKFPDHILNNRSDINVDNGGLNGIIMDLGVSSHHFDEGDRGFSFRKDAFLDMRMNYKDSSIKSAYDLVNEFSEEELEVIFREYGEEKFSRRIAAAVVEKRQSGPIKTTLDLEDIIFHCYPKKFRHGRTNPATKCFQALRIAVNREFDVLEQTIPKLLPLLKIGGRIAIITFHSLEDRIVKRAFKKLASDDLPCQIITKKPIAPTDDEISENKRSRSAKLRVIERIEKKIGKNKYKN